MENEKPTPPLKPGAEASAPTGDTAPAPPAADAPKPATTADPSTAKATASAPTKPAGAAPARPSAPPPPKPPESFGAQAELVNSLKTTFPKAVLEAKAYLGQTFLTVNPADLSTFGRYLKETPELGYNYLVDITAVDYPNKPKRFEIIYIVHSHTRNDRLILKTQIAMNESVETVSDIWTTANWLEREVYDMFGIAFRNHPDLKRILLPEGWHGFPLRKDYPIALQDEEWIKANMNILK